MSRCPSLDTLERGGAELQAHLHRCTACAAIAVLLSPAPDEPSPDTLRLTPPAPPTPDCALAELLIAAGADSPLVEVDAAFLPAHLARCRDCREAALDPPASPAGELQLPLVSPSTYLLGPEIGRGGMGRVISARDQRTGRAVALKEMLAANPGARARFEREARITARLQHPGIVSIYEVGQWPDGRPFYAMPILNGQTLGEAIAAAPRVRERLHLLPALVAAADAIAYAHSRRIIHRDLTPSNILLGSFGETVVIDWGVAKDLEEDTAEEAAVGAAPEAVGTRSNGLTVNGAVIGTPAYIAPEQGDGCPVDERADVYALGAILYHLMTGKPPYHGAGPQTVIAKLRAREPTASLPAGRGQPRDLASVVGRAMDPSPDRRYATASDLVEDLRRFQLGQRVRAHRYSPRELAGRWLSRRIAPVVVSALTLALIAAGAVVAGIRVSRERNRAEATATALLAEQGRQELLAGAPSRALIYLQEAHRRGDRSPALRLMLAAALRSVEARSQSFEVPGHPTELRFSPDGRHLAVAVIGSVHGVVIRDVRTGQLVKLLSDPRFALERAAFSGDGAFLLTWGGRYQKESGVTLWDTGTWTPRRVLAAHRTLTEVEASADGALLLAAGEDGVELYESRTGRRRAVLLRSRFPDDHLRGRFLPDGSGFLTFGYREAPTIRDLTSARPLRTVALDGEPVHALEVSRDGQRLLMTGPNGVRLWDLPKARAIASLGGVDPVLRARFSGDGTRVLVVSPDDRARLFAAKNGRPVADLGAVEGGIHGGAPVFSGDGLRLATTGHDSVRVWLAPAGSPLETYDETGNIAAMAFGPDGRSLATATYGRRVQLYDLSRSVLRGSEIRREPDNAPMPAGTPLAGSRVLAVSADRRRMLVLPTAEPSRLELRRTDDMALEFRLPAQAQLRRVGLTPDGRGVLTSDSGGQVALWLAPAGRRVDFHGFRAGLFTHAFSDDGTRLYLQETGTGKAGLWDPRDGRHVAVIQPGDATVPVFSPDGTLLAMWGDHLSVWNASDGRFLYNSGGILPVMSAGFSRDSAFIYLKSAEIGVIDARTGRLLANMDSPDGLDAAFGPDSSLLLTVGRERTSVLDWRTGRVLLHLAGDGLRDDRTRMFLAVLTATARGERRPRVNLGPNDGSVAMSYGLDRVFFWDLPLETRSPDEIERVWRARPARWRLQDGQLVPIPVTERVTPLPAPEATNLAFEHGSVGQPPPGWLVEGKGYRATLTTDGPLSGRMAATLRGLPVGNAEGTLAQIIDAAGFRGRAVRLRAALRCRPGQPAVLRLRTRGPGQRHGLNVWMLGPALCSGEWRVSELIGNVDADSLSVEFSVGLQGPGEVALDEVSLRALDP